MSEKTTRTLLGRTTLYTYEPAINESNILSVVSDSLTAHSVNASDIEYLWKYYKGKQPILNREKKIRKEINNKIVENHASEIVAFFSGYLLGEPCTYVRRGKDESVSEKINMLNEMMFSEDKASCDKELATWLYVCGVGYRMGLSDATMLSEDSPFEIYTCDPRSTFVIRSSALGQEIMVGVQIVTQPDDSLLYCGYTKTHYFETDLQDLKTWEPHSYGIVPIFEYSANTAKMGAFEPVIGLLDAINTVMSNRVDGVEQFVQSLMVLYNADIDDQAAENLRAYGLITLKSTGDIKADLKILNEELDQSQTQTLVDHMIDTVKAIVGMPSNTKGLGGGASGNMGSVLAWQGWDICEDRVNETELLFKKTEKQFLRLVLNIIRDTRGITLKLSDIDIKFSRRNIENLLVKTQALTNLLNSGVKPEVAIATIGLWNDPMDVAAQSAEYLKKWDVGNVQKQGGDKTLA